MVELTKFLRYLLISNILLFISCDSSEELINDDVINKSEMTNDLLTREDSLLQLAKDINIPFNPNTENINDILDKILIQKRMLLSKLDSLDKRADVMEIAAIQYKKKENKELRESLLSEIRRIKIELKRIKELSGVNNEIIQKDKNSIPEVKVPDMTSTFENLPTGNYIARLDKYHTISIYVSPNGEITLKEPKLDSTTVIKGGTKLNGRIAKELNQIRKKIKNND